MRRYTLIGRFLQFSRELTVLWRAFIAPETPIWIKALMLIVPGYLLSPIDLIPDFIPVAGWLDDVVIVPLLVSWIVSLLPQRAENRSRGSDGDSKTIDGTWRRL